MPLIKPKRQSLILAPTIAAVLTVVVAFTLWWASLVPEDTRTALEKVRDSGRLIFITRNSPSTYFQGPHGKAGFEYELVSRFADFLGVEPEPVTAETFGQLIPAVNAGKAHLAAANITVTPSRAAHSTFGPAYQTIRQQVLYRRGSKRPRSPEDLLNGRLAVIAGSSYVETLRELKKDFPKLSWKERTDVGIEELFDDISNGQLDYTLADSNIVTIHRRFFPSIRVGFEVGKEQKLAWAFPAKGGDSLVAAAEEFMAEMERSGELEELRRRYYSYVADFDPVGAYTFLRHVRQRLPDLRNQFEKSAQETGIDWRLLAAIGYQESHWNPAAISPTGVRGVMMLTQATADQMGVADRHDAHESILGGARYLSWMMDRIPDRIPQPDRMWLALAAYNIGWGHLEDARVITQRQGGDPDKWSDVREHLPKLSQEKHFNNTRFGYARGREPVLYVRNVRSYFDILAYLVDKDQVELAEGS